MKTSNGFTLVEIALVLIIMTILLGITLNLFSFNKNFWLIRQKSLYLGKNMNGVKTLTLQGLNFNNKKICGAGLVINSSNYEYFGLGYADSAQDCSTIASSDFNFVNPGNPPDTNPNIARITRFFTFTAGFSDLLKENFGRANLEIYCYDNCSFNSSAVINPINFKQFEVVFKNPYGEPFVFYLDQNNASGEITNWNKIKFILKFKNDASEITLTKIGQILHK